MDEWKPFTLKSKEQIVKQFEDYLKCEGYCKELTKEYVNFVKIWLAFDAPVQQGYARSITSNLYALKWKPSMNFNKCMEILIKFLYGEEIPIRPTKWCDGDCFHCKYPDCICEK